MSEASEKKMREVFNLLSKWRGIFAGWQLGTRPVSDPECQAVRDHREVSMILRAEVTGVVRILLEKKIVTVEELHDVFSDEALELSRLYEEKFPGFKPTDMGMEVNTAIARETTKGWRP